MDWWTKPVRSKTAPSKTSLTCKLELIALPNPSSATTPPRPALPKTNFPIWPASFCKTNRPPATNFATLARPHPLKLTIAPNRPTAKMVNNLAKVKTARATK